MRHVTALGVAILVSVANVPACKPDLGERDSRISGIRVLAVRGEPPEVKPGETARYELLVASPQGVVETPTPSWAFCATPKLLTENTSTSRACLAAGVRPLADGPASIEAALPTDACALFGSEVSSAELRPRDPDITGGFYQPLRVTVSGEVAFGFERIACKLANAPAEAASDFAARYRSNKNPELQAITAMDGVGRPLALDAVPLGTRVVFRATWPPESAEPYVVFDLAAQAVVARRESLRVSWFATDGTFDNDRTGRATNEPETFTDNGFIAPASPKVTHLSVVLRDDRGGVTFRTFDVITR